MSNEQRTALYDKRIRRMNALQPTADLRRMRRINGIALRICRDQAVLHQHNETSRTHWYACAKACARYRPPSPR